MVPFSKFDALLPLPSYRAIFTLPAVVGTNVGDIGLWDVGTKDRLVVKNFKVWELGKCSMALQVCLLHYVIQ